MNLQSISNHAGDGPMDRSVPLGQGAIGLLRLGGVMAMAIFLLGILLAIGGSPALAQGPDDPIVLDKMVDKTETHMGDTLRYTVTVQNVGTGGVDGLRVLDPIPVGSRYLTDTLTSSAGQAFYDRANNRVEWQGALDTQARAVISFAVVVEPGNGDTPGSTNPMCDGEIINRAGLATAAGGPQIFSPEVRSHISCPDLGDAPDSTNHAGAAMTAYTPGPVGARFPTVYGPGTAPVVGPNHWYPRADAWLGQGVSAEFDADMMPDEDGILNIDPPADMADQDRFDDGVVRRPPLKHCEPVEMAVMVTVNPVAPERDRFINVWFDWNRDGDWDDNLDCANGASPEWAVQDFVTTLGPGSHVITLPVFLPHNMGPNLDPNMDMWARVSIAEGKAPRNPTTALADGRGPDKGYRFGETEDYHIFFQQDVPDVEIHKSADVTATTPGGIIAYSIMIHNTGSSAALSQHMEDAIPAGAVFQAGSLSASAGTATYDAGSNRVKWDGDVLVGTPVTVDFKVTVATNPAPCDRGVTNVADLFPAPGTQISTLPVHVQVICQQKERGDLGDAPDSSNHDGATMTAYAGPVLADFPTVYDISTGAVQGPIHMDPAGDVWLGHRVSAEFDADRMPDADGITNLDPPKDMADRDHFDDGILRRPPLNHCEPAEMVVQITIHPDSPFRERFINAWFDWNRDGDWADTLDCANGATPEWAVQDFVTALGPGTHAITLPTFLPYNMGPNLDPTMDMWARISVADAKAPLNPTTSLADGRGPEDGYRFGETEDYLIHFGGRPDVQIDKMAHISETVPGGIIRYTVKVHNTGTVTATGLHMEDPIPAGTVYVSGSVTSSLPTASFYSGGNKVVWDGELAPGAVVHIDFEVKVDPEQPPCEKGVVNQAHLEMGQSGRLTTPPVHVRILCDQPEGNMDFGDAPDSSNHHAMDNMAYPGPGTLGRFPTVWDGTPASEGAGPAHQMSNLLWLGNRITPEKDADVLPDADGVTNILDNGGDTASANKDGADDGWLNPNVPIFDCTETVLKVRVSRSALPADLNRAFLNVWYDGNRDGDWQDDRTCGGSDQPGTTPGTMHAFEWIVRDFAVNVAAIPASGFVDISVPTMLVSNVPPTTAQNTPAWMRFTLSERRAVRPATGAAADGRGPASPNTFRLGETEDYLYQPPDQTGDPGVIELDKYVSGAPASVTVGSVYTYSIDIKHVGGTAPVMVVMSDVLPADVHLVNGPFVTEVAPSVSPLFAAFDAGFGPSGRIGWHGHLTPDAAVRVTFAVRVRHCPASDVAGNAPTIVNKAVVERPDGSVIEDIETTPVDCQPPQPPQIDVVKRILVERTDDNGTVNTVEEVESEFFSGQQPVYGIFVHNMGGMTETVAISDVLPSGLVAVNVSSNFGLAQIVNAGHGVVWSGAVGPGNSPAVIKIRVKPTGTLICNRVLENKVRWQLRGSSQNLSGESNVARLFLACQDLGDAPDSTNHPGVAMDAYIGQPANFPTVFDVAAPERGPKHVEPRPFHLGPGVTAEREADMGFDMDPTHNILPRLNQADLDKRDDGINPATVVLNHCAINRIDVRVSIAPSALALLNAANDGIGYLNVWVDSDRDGDWADTADCPPDPTTNLSFAQEHIVIDFPVDVATLGPGLHTLSVPTTVLVSNPADKATQPMWMRLTLSEQKSVKPFSGPSGPYGDGRGPDSPFRLGETEDYLLPPTDQQGEADPTVTKKGHLSPMYDQTNNVRMWQINWLVDYANTGSAPATNVHVVDTYAAPQQVIRQHAVPPAPMTPSGNTLDYNVGTLNAGATGSIVIQTAVPFTTAPGTVLTNTVVINSDNDGNSLNNTAVATVTVPLLPPVIISPLPGTTCSGSITVTGRVQPGAVVDLYVDSALHSTATPDSTGFWSVAVTGLADGSHDIYAVARLGSITSGASATVVVIVDSTLFWDPLSLRFIEDTGHVIVPSGRLDESGWSVFLQRGHTYTVTLRVCCDAENPVVTMELGSLMTVNLTDPDGDNIYAGTFTTPADGPFEGAIRICVICELIKKCSDGEVTIDPEGNVYDLTTGVVLGGSTVACFQSVVSDAASEGTYDLWPAVDFDQINPQTTGSDGYFSFFTPAGTYQLHATFSGYQPYRSWDLVVVDAPVHFDVPMTPVISKDADHVVAITGNGFEPSYLTVAPGDVIEWVNVDTGLHTSTSITPTVAFPGSTRSLQPTDGWDSGLLDTGDSYKRSLSAQGTYTYADHENPEITATIVVETATVEYKIFLPLVTNQ